MRLANASVEAAAVPQRRGDERVLVIEPGASRLNYWKDVWHYRELFFILAWRDVAVRYKQTIIGIVWAVLRPFFTMVVFTVIFGGLAGLPSDGGAPYALMVFSAMLPWTLFSSALTDSSNSLVANANLIGKIYFPRIVVPAAAVVTALVDFLVGLAILGGLMVFYQFAPESNLLFLPFFIVLAFLASLGPGLWMAGLNVKYRDFRIIVPFIVQLGLFISPVGFSSSVIPDRWRLVYSLNPMVGVIDGFRWCILGDRSPLDVRALALSVVVIFLLLWAGMRQFRKMEATFADII